MEMLGTINPGRPHLPGTGGDREDRSRYAKSAEGSGGRAAGQRLRHDITRSVSYSPKGGAGLTFEPTRVRCVISIPPEDVID